MLLHALVARRALAAQESDGESSVEFMTANSGLKAEGILNVKRFSQMIAPGLARH
jgi:hypothetical protein